MISGLGNDIIEIDRVQKLILEHGQKFLDKIFTKAEQEYCSRFKDSASRYAGRFAAKEAIVKALGTGFSQGISWLDVEAVNDERGKPMVRLHGKAGEMFAGVGVILSISHCRTFAVATAVACSS